MGAATVFYRQGRLYLHLGSCFCYVSGGWPRCMAMAEAIPNGLPTCSNLPETEGSLCGKAVLSWRPCFPRIIFSSPKTFSSPEAMSMFWDASRAENGMACLQYEMWGIRPDVTTWPFRVAELFRQGGSTNSWKPT